MNDTALLDIAKSLKVLAMIESDKQIAYLRSEIKKCNEGIKDIKKYSNCEDTKPLEKKIKFYEYKIKTYENLLK